MRPTAEQHAAFFSGEGLPGVGFRHGEAVAIAGQADVGVIVSVERLGDDPEYLVESGDGQDRLVRQSALSRLSALERTVALSKSMAGTNSDGGCTLMSEASTDDKPEWDNLKGQSYLGKYILVGVTYLDAAGKEKGLQQMHGRIVKADPVEGIEISLGGAYEGQMWTMPPDQRAIVPAEPGTYRLHSTGEEVVDPDLTSTWTVQDPAEGA